LISTRRERLWPASIPLWRNRLRHLPLGSVARSAEGLIL
jgi:hypothetical protein